MILEICPVIPGAPYLITIDSLTSVLTRCYAGPTPIQVRPQFLTPIPPYNASMISLISCLKTMVFS